MWLFRSINVKIVALFALFKHDCSVFILGKRFFTPFLETRAVFLFLSFSTMHFLVSTLSPLSSTPPAESGLVCEEGEA